MKIPFFLIFGILAVLFFIFGGYMHESAHQEIYRSYGIDSKIIIDFPDLKTIPEKNCEQNTCVLANNINESIGYQLQMFYLMIFTGLMIIISLMEWRMENEF